MTDAEAVGWVLSVDEQGIGPACLFVHGMGGDMHGWDRLWPRLERHRRSIRYDLRGFGASVAVPDDGFLHASDLAGLLDHLEIEACDLVGISMGGGIALNFALDHPNRVRSLVLISPQILGWDWSDAWRTDWRRITDAARGDRLEEARRLWWEHPLFATTRRSPAAVDLWAEIARFAGRQWLADHQDPILPDVERLHTLRPPTLLLAGRDDVDELRLMADIIAASAEQVRRIDMIGGHLLQMEVPDQCADHLAVFLGQHSPIG